ncbi:MAG: zinc-ribbon domain-containing protein [Candidatus Binatus sp.]
MIEIQCTSCHTRYRIDERVLPDDTPTFKCSRCGHVFNADPVPARVRKVAPQAADSESQPARMIRPARPRPSAFKSQVESDVVKREPVAERPAPPPEPEVRSQPVQAAAPAEPVGRNIPDTKLDEPEVRTDEPQPDPAADDPLNRTFGDREQKADTGENLRFDFSDERKQIDDVAPEHEIERPEPDDGGWEVGETPAEFEAAPRRQAPTLIAEPEPPPRAAPTPPRRTATPLRAPAVRFASPEKSAAFQMGNAGEDDADSVWVGATHSSGFFIAIFIFVAIAFLVASAVICGEPAASVRMLGQAPQIGAYFARPVVPAMLVALHDIRSEYYTLKGGHVALVVTGNAENVGTAPLHLVQIDAYLIGDSAHPIASLSVYCGNELSATMLSEMTPREIEFSQGLSPQKAFAIDPSASAPFLMVFIDPPGGAGKIRLAVSKAAPQDSDSSPSPAPPA